MEPSVAFHVIDLEPGAYVIRWNLPSLSMWIVLEHNCVTRSVARGRMTQVAKLCSISKVTLRFTQKQGEDVLSPRLAIHR